VYKYRKRLDFAGLSRHLLSVEAQPLFYCQCFIPASDGAGSHPDRPGKGKIKKYAKIKRFYLRNQMMPFSIFLAL